MNNAASGRRPVVLLSLLFVGLALVACSTPVNVKTGDGTGSDGGGAGHDAGSGKEDAGSTKDDAGNVGPVLDCGAIVACESTCPPSSDACREKCLSRGSPAAQQLAEALDTCVAAVCPRTSGSICESLTMACQTCEGGALSNGCAVLYGACVRDHSGTSDGGMETSDGGVTDLDGGMTGSDGGTSFGTASCFDISLCSNGCFTESCLERCQSYGTEQAQADYTGLLECIYQACPRTGGGICDYNAPKYNASSCSACIQKAEGPSMPCFDLAISCNGTLCAKDSTCASSQTSPQCDESIGYCVQCTSASDCGAGGACVDYVCQSATLSCIGIYSCTYGCAGDECRQNCVEGGIPSAQVTYQGYMNCQDAACPSANNGPCDPNGVKYDQGYCSACIQQAQSNTCYPQIAACLNNCHENADCYSNPATPACDRVTSTCVQCVRTSDCQSGQICASHVCIKTCSTTTDCPADQTCDDGICVANQP